MRWPGMFQTNYAWRVFLPSCLPPWRMSLRDLRCPTRQALTLTRLADPLPRLGRNGNDCRLVGAVESQPGIFCHLARLPHPNAAPGVVHSLLITLSTATASTAGSNTWGSCPRARRA
jgi:hypothetical protein